MRRVVSGDSDSPSKAAMGVRGGGGGSDCPREAAIAKMSFIYKILQENPVWSLTLSQ